MAARARSAQPDEATTVMIALRRIVRFLRLADREVEAACDVSAAQLFVLHVLLDAPAASLSEIAARTLTDQSSVSVVVSRLVDRGLVKRGPSTRDARRMEVVLTAPGRALLRRAPEITQTRIIAGLERMPRRDRAALARLLTGLVDEMESASEVAPMFFEDPAPRARRRKR